MARGIGLIGIDLVVKRELNLWSGEREDRAQWNLADRAPLAESWGLFEA
jgi:hypothetical protein